MTRILEHCDDTVMEHCDGMVRRGWVLLLHRFDMIFVYFLKVKLAGFTRVLVIRCWIKKKAKLIPTHSV